MILISVYHELIYSFFINISLLNIAINILGMATIPDTMKNISKDIQNVFEEIVILLLRKSIHPATNPLSNNTNPIRRYERGLSGSPLDESINKYSYLMTNDTLGWDSDTFASFKMIAKFITNSFSQETKYSTNNKSKCRIFFTESEIRDSENCHSKSKPDYPIACTFGKRKIESSSNKEPYGKPIRSVQTVLACKKPSSNYSSDIKYSYSFKSLEDIGQDIINQTDPLITAGESSRMSTAMLRIKTYNLEQDLYDLMQNNIDIFDSFIDMVRIINSVQKTSMQTVINLVATLTYQKWSDLSDRQQMIFTETLGCDFIDDFNSNELITILLQSDNSELILSCAYYYSLSKLLFVIFGYSKLTPRITFESCDSKLSANNKFYNKYQGGGMRRRDDCGADIKGHVPFRERDFNSECPSDFDCQSERSDSSDYECADYIPVNPCTYNFIKLFGGLYPTIIGLMGGTEIFPPENLTINCGDILESYHNLKSLPEFLWRFNDYSYCKYVELNISKRIGNAVDYKISNKLRLLRNN